MIKNKCNYAPSKPIPELYCSGNFQKSELKVPDASEHACAIRREVKYTEF